MPYKNKIIYFFGFGIFIVSSKNSSSSLYPYSAGISNFSKTCFIVLTYNFAGSTFLVFFLFFFNSSLEILSNSLFINSSVFFTFNPSFITFLIIFSCNSSFGRVSSDRACLSVNLLFKHIPLTSVLNFNNLNLLAIVDCFFPSFLLTHPE